MDDLQTGFTVNFNCVKGCLPNRKAERTAGKGKRKSNTQNLSQPLRL